MRNIFIATSIGLLAAGQAVPAGAGVTIEIDEPTLVAHIDKSTQRMTVKVNGETKYTWKVSTGTSEYKTPVGTFAPFRMHTMWRSQQYDFAPMPHSVFFNDGIAVHGTNATGRLGRPASHGCVRLAPGNAKRFFDLVLEHGRARTEISVGGEWGVKLSGNKQRKTSTE